jgi:hypothetical protein
VIKITGSVANLDDDGSAEINISMGGMNLPVAANTSWMKQGKFEFTSTLMLQIGMHKQELTH